MKKQAKALCAAGLVFTLSISGCRKTADDSSSSGNNSIVLDTVGSKTVEELSQTVPYPRSGSTSCSNSAAYVDSVVYPQDKGGSDYIISPLNNLNISGTYLAWPGGLVIDPNTGSINVSKSESGQRYAIGFTASGSGDTCLSFLTLSGADWLDSIYVSAVSSRSSQPFYNGSVDDNSACLGNACQFDYDNEAAASGIFFDKHKGFIDLEKTMNSSLFAVTPIDGTYFYFTVAYKTDQVVDNPVQHIELRFIYYGNKSDIPASLTQSINSRTEALKAGPSAGASQSRPPLIVITRNN